MGSKAFILSRASVFTAPFLAQKYEKGIADVEKMKRGEELDE